MTFGPNGLLASQVIITDYLPSCDTSTWTWRWGKREIIHLSLQCHRQNDSCIQMGSDERDIEGNRESGARYVDWTAFN